MHLHSVDFRLHTVAVNCCDDEEDNVDGNLNAYGYEEEYHMSGWSVFCEIKSLFIYFSYAFIPYLLILTEPAGFKAHVRLVFLRYPAVVVHHERKNGQQAWKTPRIKRIAHETLHSFRPSDSMGHTKRSVKVMKVLVVNMVDRFSFFMWIMDDNEGRRNKIKMKA